jgi:hypothetical protein
MLTFKQFLKEAEREIYAKKIENAPEWSPAVAEEDYKVGKITYSATKGFGSVPNNANVNYMGFIGFMKPSTFMSLALDDEGQQEETSKDLENFVEQGYAIGIPFLYIKFDEDGNTLPKITGHEGRGRMRMARRVNDDEPMPVHFFLSGGLRSRDVTADMADEVKQGVFAEKSERLVKHPVTKLYVDGRKM